ncbi:MAG TPA: arginase family protein [Streptosporangiaceae bacterium]|nr:arginase family protein [Streptosporangiaceae bacterium]
MNARAAARPVVTTGVPIDCVSAAAAGSPRFGTELSPAALRQAGLPAAAGAADGGDLGVRLVGRDRDPATGVLGWPSVLATTQAVRAHVRDQVAAGQLPFLLGGCCTLLPGALSGARDVLGQVGLGYLDGHLDLYDGQTSDTGEPADMGLSVITGRGPAAWSALIGAPLVTRPQLVLLGPRDRDEAAGYGSVMPEEAGLDGELSPAILRDRGLAGAGRAARDQLSAAAGRYWVHLDVDVLDELAFPATDYLMPGGLTLAELGELIWPLLASPALAGVSLACYNPQKDPGGQGAAALVDLFSGLGG